MHVVSVNLAGQETIEINNKVVATGIPSREGQGWVETNSPRPADTLKG